MTAPAIERGFRAPGTGFMVLGSLVGAVGAYLFQVIGVRALGPATFAPIAILWTVFFIVVTVVLVPLEQYVTREASRGRAVLRADRDAILAVTAIAALAGGGFVLVTRDALFDGNPAYVLDIVLVMAGYTVLLVGKGILAGHRRFAGVGWILIWEGVARLAVAGAILVAVRSAPALAWAMVAAPFAALLTRYWRHDEQSSGAPRTRARGFLGAYIGGSAASQLLLAGAPLGVAALGGSPEMISITFVMFTLFRGPLTLIYSLQGRLLPYLVRLAADNDHGLRRMGLLVISGGVLLAGVGGVVGWLIGPDVVALLFGDASRPDRVAAALAAAGILAASTTQIAGQVLVARGRTGRLAIAWITGLLVAIPVLFGIGLGPDRSVAAGFAAGEASAVLTAALLILGRGR